MKRIEWSIRSKTARAADWDFRINPAVFLYSIYMKRIEISSIRSTSNLKSILKSSRSTWVLRSDRLDNVHCACVFYRKTSFRSDRPLNALHVNISPADLTWQSARVFDRIDKSTQSASCEQGLRVYCRNLVQKLGGGCSDTGTADSPMTNIMMYRFSKFLITQ